MGRGAPLLYLPIHNSSSFLVRNLFTLVERDIVYQDTDGSFPFLCDETRSGPQISEAPNENIYNLTTVLPDRFVAF